MKKKTILAICFLIVFVLVKTTFQRAFHESGHGISTEYYIKEDQFKNSGKLSAYANDRIFYFSRENEISGIYSMEFDGKNVQLVVPCDGIGKIQVQNDKLYYLEYQNKNISEDINRPRYELREYDLKNKRVKNIEVYPNDLLYENSLFRAVWDFYCFDNGEMLVSTVNIGVPNSKRIFYDFYMIDSKHEQLVPADKIDKLEQIEEDNDFGFYQYDNLLFRVENYLIDIMKQEHKEWYLYGQRGVSMIDENTGYPVYSPENVFFDTKTNFTLKLLWDNTVFYSERNTIGILNLKNGEREWETQLPKYGCVKWAQKHKDYILLGEGKLATSIHFGEKIYSLNLETKAIDLVKDFKDKETVYIDEEKIVVASGKVIECYRFENTRVGELIWKLNLQENILDRGYRVEACGNWLFICRLASRVEGEQCDNLINKINLLTGEDEK